MDVEDDGDVLARFFKFTGGTSQVHWGHHCDAPGTRNHVNRPLQRRSSQVGRQHMRTGALHASCVLVALDCERVNHEVLTVVTLNLIFLAHCIRSHSTVNTYSIYSHSSNCLYSFNSIHTHSIPYALVYLQK